MNLTEQYGARSLAFIMPHHNVGPTSGWKGYVLRATILGIGFGTYILLFKRKDLIGRWGLRRSQKTSIDRSNRNPNSEINKHSDSDRSIMTYNGEVCPICLGAPKIGVKAPCGHLLCADCLASYCDVRIAPAPPPCPLCRAPLNSVALACDFTILNPETVDPDVQDWIREYNNHRGLMMSGRSSALGFLTTRLALFLNILILFLIVGLIAARLQVLTETLILY